MKAIYIFALVCAIALTGCGKGGIKGQVQLTTPKGNTLTCDDNGCTVTATGGQVYIPRGAILKESKTEKKLSQLEK